MIWDGCGVETESVIKLGDSSNIVIENCSFQHSKGPAVVLSRVSGHVNVNHSNFVHNNHYQWGSWCSNILLFKQCNK